MEESSRAGSAQGGPRAAALGLGVALFLGACASAPQASLPPPLALGPEDRILVLAPHPDDEVLGAGGILQAAVARGLPLRVLFLTHGDANEWSFLAARKRPTLRPAIARQMGERRRNEALEAAAVLGVPPEEVVFLGYPDKRALSIWLRHWGDSPPRSGALTRAREVPYLTALRPGAPHRGDEILADLRQEIQGFRPTRVFVSHPADRHGDHAALYLFTRAALWELEGEVSATLHPYLVHYPGWPGSRGFRPHRGLAPPKSLAELGDWRSWPLAPEEVVAKRDALAAHQTQYGYSAKRLLPLVRSNELFGDLAPVRLAAPGATAVIDDDHDGPEPVEGEEPWGNDWNVPEDDVTRTDSQPRASNPSSAHLGDGGATTEVDLQRLTLRLEEAALVLEAEIARPLSELQSLQLFLAGHRPGTPFSSMPKLEVRVGATRHATFDGGVRLPAGAVEVARSRSRVTIRVPLAALGAPDRLLLGARLASDRAQDRLPWRVVELGSGLR